MRNPTLVDAYAAGELRDVEARLIIRFAPPLRPEEVQRHLLDTLGSFEQAAVRTYLPILVERATARRLEAALAARPTLVAPGGGA